MTVSYAYATLAELDEAARELSSTTGVGYERCLLWCQNANRQAVDAAVEFEQMTEAVVAVFNSTASAMADFVTAFTAMANWAEIAKRAERRRRHASWQARRRA